jgi:UDP-N-acetylglucosamine 2-epimerase (non-hydrolysing)
MTSPRKLLVIAGTRPEIIKQAPLRFAALGRSDWQVRFCFSGQHRDMGAQAFGELGFLPDETFELMRPGQTPSDFLGSAVPALSALIRQTHPDWIAVQGDTTTALAGALAGFYERTSVVHIEAGLRTYDAALPFPEEMHRQLITRLATAHAAPTSRCVAALRREGVPAANILLAGNTGIDSLLRTVAHPPGHEGAEFTALAARIGTRRLVLVTMHRRESFGETMTGMCRAIARLARDFPATAFILPVHHNPAVKSTVESALGGMENVILTAPLGYAVFSRLLARAQLAITDSGGVQEEAPTLGVPVLVLRDVTERPEAVECGGAILAGCEENRIHSLASALLGDPAAHARMAVARFPYGDGRAGPRILDWLATRPATAPELCLP